MKKLLKRKLFNQNGYTKNYFLWEISTDKGPIFEVIEEFKGHSIARVMLKGLFYNKLKALNEFRKIVVAEEASARRVPIGHRLVFS